MTWVRDTNLTWLQRIAVNVLKSGPVPNHIAFIMDGNRRFATKSNLKKAEGHSKGFDKLSETLQWCLDIGIKEVTVYAFSIENFKRSNEEVEMLMSLAREKFSKLLSERDRLHERGVCIRIIGNVKLLADDLQKTIAEAVLLTKDNSTSILNVGFAYTSRDEITHSIQTVARGIEENDLSSKDVTEDLLSNCLYTKNCTPPDLLVRTSGEARLSDFLLWQCSSTTIYFTKTLWPEFTIWHLLGGVFYYQRCYFHMNLIKNALDNLKESPIDEKNGNLFLEKQNRKEIDEMKKLISVKQ